jgi:hypothetical protein
MNITTHNNKGFVILFTVLVASIILAIALGVASVSYREVLLSATAKDAEFSFFSADTGAECALYWDIQQSAFGTTLVTPSCNGGSVDMTSLSSPYTFRFATSAAGCASVTVDKSDPTNTKIESLGYNVSCNDLITAPTNPRIVERAIRVTYGPGQPPDANPNADQTTAQAGPSSAATSLSSPTPTGFETSATATAPTLELSTQVQSAVTPAISR